MSGVVRAVPKPSVEGDGLTVLHVRLHDGRGAVEFARPSRNSVVRRIAAAQPPFAYDLLNRLAESVRAGGEAQRGLFAGVLKADPNRNETAVRRRAFNIGVPIMHDARLLVDDPCPPKDDVIAQDCLEQLKQSRARGDVVEQAVGRAKRLASPVLVAVAGRGDSA